MCPKSDGRTSADWYEPKRSKNKRDDAVPILTKQGPNVSGHHHAASKTATDTWQRLRNEQFQISYGPLGAETASRLLYSLTVQQLVLFTGSTAP